MFITYDQHSLPGGQHMMMVYVNNLNHYVHKESDEL